MTLAPASPALPRGAWLVIAIEFWERFSFYGMLGILALFLTAAPAAGGFGWSDGDTLALVGLYTGLMYGLPMLGGLLADRVLGARRAIAIGATLLAFGHFLMASPVVLPWLLGLSEQRDLLGGLTRAGVPLGYLAPPATLANDAPLRLAYALQAWGFHAALACLVIGNGIMKASMAVLIGDLFTDADSRRERAFAYFYLSISVGGFLSEIIVGFVATVYGWHWGFTLAGVGMLCALVPYLALGMAWLGATGQAPRARAAPAQVDGTAAPRIALLLALAAFVCLFEIGWFQLYGSWTLLMESGVDRGIMGFTVPTPWLLALNSLVVVAITPLLAAWWARRAAAGRAMDPLTRYAVALALTAGATALMAGVAGGGRGSLLLPVGAITLLSIAEIFIWVANYGLVYRLAPSGIVTLAMGSWYAATLGLGGWLAGWLAAQWPHAPGQFLVALAAALMTGSLLIALLAPRLRRRAATLKVALTA
jgi:POT family proton-dependent oligopeptide transporter